MTSTGKSARRRRFFPTWEERKKSAYSEARILIAAGYLLAAFAMLFPHVSATENSFYVALCWFAFLLRTFLFHGGLGLALILGVAWFHRCWRLLLGGLPLLIFCLGSELTSYLPSKPQPPAKPGIKLMSANLLFINRNMELLDEIVQNDPDVICLQEYTSFWHDQMQRRLGKNYAHVMQVHREDAFGAAIYSKLPFREKQYIALGGSAGEPQMRVVIEIAGRRVSLYNVHLFPPSSITYKRIGGRQFLDLIGQLTVEEKLPVVVAGDFNFTQASQQSDVIKGYFHESHSKAGWGRGSTWNVRSFLRYLPGLRLDHVYYSPQLTCEGSRHGRGAGSDHRPVIVTNLGWRKRQD